MSGFEDRLGELGAALPEAPAEVRRTVGQLTSKNGALRMAGLDRVLELAHSAEARPFLFALGTAQRYPQAAAILLRLGAALAVVDAPPRSRPTPAAEALADAYAVHASALFRVARTSRDPEAARAAARILGHLTGRDAQLLPLLLALLSGAADATERAPLLYFHTRARLAAGFGLHPRAKRALEGTVLDPERVAVALSYQDAGASAPEEAAATLAVLPEAAEKGSLPDPRRWGATLG